MNEQAKKAARTGRRRKLRKRAVRAATYAALATYAAVAIFGSTLPPEPRVCVVAWTGAHWYRAYMDENGDFRSCEDGLPIGQVVKWSNPTPPLW